MTTLDWKTVQLEADMANGTTTTVGDWESLMAQLGESVRARIAELEAQVADLTARLAGETVLREKMDRARTHVTAAAEELTDG